ncbi:MAG: hypothetical protein WB005_08625, partial [Pseudolabrys sp.]
CALYINRAQMDALFADKSAVRPWLCIFTGKLCFGRNASNYFCNATYIYENDSRRAAPHMTKRN